MKTGPICDKHPDLNGLRYNSGHCCQCKKDNNRKWDLANSDRVRKAATERMNRFRNTEKGAESVKSAKSKHYYKNVEASREYQRVAKKKAYSLFPAREIMRVRNRKNSLAERTPSWVDQDAVNAIYLRARELGQTVDHVIPLRGKNVSGLHVASNLQIVPRSFNSSKGNRF